jgi:predicted lipoprotein with Yx(FWY)xxD motif
VTSFTRPLHPRAGAAAYIAASALSFHILTTGAIMSLKPGLTAIVLALAAVNGANAAQPARFDQGLMVDAKGMTLYTFDRDAQGRSACYGGCAAAWPPALAASDARPVGDFSVVERDDGGRQWAYHGRPLYRYAGDARAGDVNGDRQGGVWHAIRATQGTPAGGYAY